MAKITPRDVKTAEQYAAAEERATKAAERRAEQSKFELAYAEKRHSLSASGITRKEYEKEWKLTQKKKKEEEEITKLRKQGVLEGKKTRDLARDHSKFLKSNAGSLLKELGIVHDTNAIAEGASDAGKKAAKEKDASKKKELLADQAGWNRAGEARKQAMAEIEQGTFDAQTYSENLEASLPKGISPKVRKKIMKDADDFGGKTQEIIGDDPDAFAAKMTLSKEAMSSIDGFKDKIFKAKSFLTDPKFRGMMLKGMFIGLAVKAAKALGDALKAGFDFAREMGISMSSMPLAVGFAKEEAGALLDEFKTLEGVTSGNLLNMKWNAYWTGVSASDSAKLAKLQMSITDSSLEMALDDQAKFMKELKDEGLSASKVMADMAGHSEFVAKYMKDGGKNMEEAAKQAASMGLSLDATSSVAESLLDWESSIAAEMEASMILGRSINLDKARQLAYSGDIEGMMREAKIQAGGEAEFAKMSVVQREALGDALGLNASQMAEFTKAQDASNASGKATWKTFAMWGGVVGGIVGLAIALKTVLKSIPTMGWGAFSGAADLVKTAAYAASGVAIGGVVVGGAAKMAGRERGGPVRAGNPYVVGEKQAELFVPGVSGNILPSVPGMQDGSLQWPDMGKLSDTLGGKLDQIASFLNQGNEDRNFGNRKLGGQIERSGGQF